MTATYDDHTGNGSNKNFTYTFPVLLSTDVKVSVDGVTQTSGYTVNTGNTRVEFTTAPLNLAKVRVYRETAVGKASGDEDPKAVFAAGSSVRAVDLNNNFEQALFATHELQDQLILAEDIDTGAVTSAKILDGTIVDGDINASAQIAVNKLADGSARQVLQTAANGSDVEWTNNVDIPGTLDVTSSAVFDSNITVGSGASISGNTTVGGTLGVTGTTTAAAINASGAVGVDGNFDVNTNKFTVASSTGNTTVAGTLGVTGLSTLASVDINGGAIDGTTIGASSAAAGSFTTINASGTITGNITGEVTGNAATATDLAASAKVTNSEQVSHSVNDTTYFTTSASDARYYNIGTTEEIVSGETWVGDDAKVATTKAIDNRIVDILDDVGGFIPLTDETLIPQHHPEKENVTASDRVGTILSIGTLTTTYTPSGGTCTIQASDLTNHSVNATITDCGSTVLSAGFGVLVETKPQTDQQYADGPSFKFHRLVPKATEVTTVAGKAAEITTCHNQISNINAVAADIADVTAVAADATDIGVVAGKATQIQTVHDNITNINDVANNATNINAVAADATDIGVVAGKATEIGRLGTADAVADMNTLGTAAIVEDMNLLGTAAVVEDMSLLGVQAVIDDMATIADTSNLISNIGTVAGIQANVTTVAGNSANVTTVATNMGTVNDFGARYRAATNNAGEYSSNNDAGDLYFNTDINALKVWTGSAWVAGVTQTGDYAVTTGDTFTGNLKLNDSVELRVGTGDDLKIYHTANDYSYITDSSGRVYLKSDRFYGQAADGVNQFYWEADAGTNLYFDGALKLETFADGVKVKDTGNNTSEIELTTAQGDGGSVYANTADSPSGSLGFLTSASEWAIRTLNNGSVELYHDAAKVFYTTTAGAIVKRPSGGETQFQITGCEANDAELRLVADDGDDNNDAWKIAANAAAARLRVQNFGTGTWETNIEAISEGAVKLDYDNTTKFETYTSGVKVAGKLLSQQTSGNSAMSMGDNVRIDFGDGDDLKVYHDGSDSYIKHNGQGNFYIQTSEASVEDLYLQAGNDVYIRPQTGDNGIHVQGDGNVSLYYDGAIKCYSTAVGFKIHTSAHLELGDSSEARFGSGDDLKISHNGSHALFKTYTGNTYFYPNGTDSELGIAMYPNAAVELYHNNVKTLETEANGVIVQGPEGGDGILRIYADEGDNDADKWRLFSSSASSELRIQNINNGSSWDNNIKCFGDAATELYYDGSKKLDTRSGGIGVEGHVYLGDNGTLVLGADSDMMIWHAGDHGYIYNKTGWGILRSDNWQITDKEAGDVMANFKHDGAVELFHDNVKTFETEDNGIYVYGPEGGIAQIMLYADEGDDNSDKWRMAASTSSSQFRIYNYEDGGWETSLECNGAGAVKLDYDNSTKFSTLSNGAQVHGSFYLDDNHNIQLNDTNKLVCGAGSDLQIFHDGYNRICGDNLYINNKANSTQLIYAGNGSSVQLFYDGTKKFETTGSGTETTGLHMIKGVEGGDANLYLYADEGDDAADKYRIVSESSGNTLRIQDIPDNGTWEDKIVCTNNAGTAIYHNNSKKFETTSYGFLTQGTGGGDGVNVTVENTNSEPSGVNLKSGHGNWSVYTSKTIGDALEFRDESANSTRMYINSSGSVYAQGVYDATTGSGANVEVSSGGKIRRSTSSRRYKTSIETLEDKYADAILEARPVWYKSLCEDDDKDHGHWGFIAEEIEKIDPRLCTYKSVEVEIKDYVVTEKKLDTPIVESVQYDRFVPHLINLIKRQDTRIKELETKVAALEAG